MDAFDADVLIYAAAPQHPLGRRVARLLEGGDAGRCVGSVLLVPELLTRPMREGAGAEVTALVALLARLELRSVDRTTAELAAGLGATYGLRAADAVHLATAVQAGAERFVTNNRNDFPRGVSEVAVTYPQDLREG